MKSPLNIKLDKIAHMPTRAHFSDAGLDLYSPFPVSIVGAFPDSDRNDNGFGSSGR